MTETNTYGPSTEFNTIHIVSDYGKRLKVSSSWHRGVDFNLGAPISRWDHFLSLNKCDVKILQGGVGYKRIITDGTLFGEPHDFGYGHLFDDLPPTPTNIKGDLVLIKMDGIPDEYAIIQTTGPSFKAFGPVAGTVTYGGNVYTVTDKIEKDEVLGNIGRSYNGGSYAFQHVHVYYFRDIYEATKNALSYGNPVNDCDPLAVISHANTIYDVFLFNDNNINPQNIVTSSGSNAVSIKAQYIMKNSGMTGNKFSSAVMDIDNVDIFIKPSYKPLESDHSNWGNTNSNYQLIRGEFVDSHLSHGARYNSEIYPRMASTQFGYNANPPSNTAIDIIPDGKYGSFTSTGIDPFAYRDNGNQPFDDYYFSDFYTRVVDGYELGDNHTFAPCNEKAMYPDDKYELFSRVVTVRDDPYSTISNPTTEIIIDNFRPFIKKVEIRKEPNAVPEYSRGWNWNGSEYLFEPLPCPGLSCPNIKTTDDLFIKVYTSEAMTNNTVTLKINGTPKPATPLSEDGTEWGFEISSNDLVAGLNTIEIDGKDLATNDLLKNPQNIPIRQANDVWLPNPGAFTGPDVNHSFDAQEPSEVDFTATQLGDYDWYISFTDISTLPNIQTYYWDFGNGENSTYEDVSYQYGNAGTYYVTHIITDGDDEQYSISKNVLVENLDPPVSNFMYAIKNSGGKAQVEINFFDLSEGYVTSWDWDFGDGSTTSTVQNPTIALNMFETYNISLTVTNAAGSSVYQVEFYYDPTQTPTVSIIPWQDLAFNYNFDISVSNIEYPQPLMGDYTYEVNFGDGTSQTLTDELNWVNVSHQYFNWDSYLVTAKVTGENENYEEETYSTAIDINVSQWDIDVQLSYSAPTSPPYPGCQVVIIDAVVPSNVGEVAASWYIYKVGDPGISETFSFGYEYPISQLNYSFPEEGTYRVGIDVVGMNGGMGHNDITIEVENAPQFIEAGFYPFDPIQLGVGSTQTFENSSWPIGNPGVHESQWYPTNIRWTLFDTANNNAVILPDEGDGEEVFQYELFNQVYYENYTFTTNGTYKLRLEVWNNTHGYSPDDLNPECANSLPFYDYIEKEIVVSNNIPFLVITNPEPPEFWFDADGNPYNTISFTNPGSEPLYITAIAYPIDNLDFIDISFYTFLGINNGNIGNIYFDVYSNNNPDTRYGGIEITAIDASGNEVQGSPFFVRIEQAGNMGPFGQFVYNDPPIQDENFGTAIGIDDNYAVIGAVDDNENGKAYIAERNNIGIWNVVATLQATDLFTNKFGRSVDIHGDYAIVGAEDRAYVFKKPGSGWSGTINSIASSIVNAEYGHEVSIWGDWAVVSAWDWVKILYRNQGGNTDSWGVNHTIVGNSGSRFGYSIDLYNDLLAVGVPYADNGEIHIYNRNHNQPNDWSLEYIFEAPYYAPSDAFLGGKGFDIYDNKLFYSHRLERANSCCPELITDFLERDENGTWNNTPLSPGNYVLENESAEIDNFNSLAANNCAVRPGINLVSSLSGYYSKPYDIMSDYGDIVGGSATTQQWNDGAPNSYADGPWNTGANFSYSLKTDFNTIMVGGPNKNSDIINDCGSVYFYDYRIRRKCFAEVVLSLINFEKPAGNYPDVSALNITLGGEGYDAVIRDGANISYFAEEIVLDDGFVAEDGAEFLAEATVCNVDLTNAMLPENHEYINENSFVGNSTQQTEPDVFDNMLIINMRNIRKQLARKYSTYPWHQIDFTNDLNQIAIVDTSYNVISTIEKPNPVICVFDKSTLPDEYSFFVKIGERTFHTGSFASLKSNRNKEMFNPTVK